MLRKTVGDSCGHMHRTTATGVVAKAYTDSLKKQVYQPMSSSLSKMSNSLGTVSLARRAGCLAPTLLSASEAVKMSFKTAAKQSEVTE